MPAAQSEHPVATELIAHPAQPGSTEPLDRSSQAASTPPPGAPEPAPVSAPKPVAATPAPQSTTGAAAATTGPAVSSSLINNTQLAQHTAEPSPVPSLPSTDRSSIRPSHTLPRDAGLPKELLWLHAEYPELSGTEVLDAWKRFKQVQVCTLAGASFVVVSLLLFVLASMKHDLIAVFFVSAGTVVFGTASRFLGLSASGFVKTVRAVKILDPRVQAKEDKQ